MAHKLTILVASLFFIRDGGLAAILLESEPTSTAGIQGAADISITADDGAVTPPPEMIELHRRQESTIKYLLAPDATCGFDSKGMVPPKAGDSTDAAPYTLTLRPYVRCVKPRLTNIVSHVGTPVSCPSPYRCGFISASASTFPARQSCCASTGCVVSSLFFMALVFVVDTVRNRQKKREMIPCTVRVEVMH